jgi:predicted outer membrane repeat protein
MRHPLAVKVAGTALLCACAILGAVVGAPPARAAELYVDVVAKAGDGSKAKPLATITEALAAAHRIEDESERIVIRLARGTYKSKSAGGKEDIPAEGWTIRRPIWIVGSYTRDGGEWKLKPHSGAVELGYPTTVIDLSGHGRGFLVEAPKWKRSPLPEGWLHDELKQKEATPSVRLQGLAIRSGRVDTEGGAVLSRGDAPLEVLNCDFENNRAAWRGGAICVDPADKTSVAFFRQCVLKGNAATGEDAWGGGIYSEANTHVRKCRLYNNKAAHGAACGGRNASAWNMVFCLAYANEGDFAVHVRSRRDMNWRSRTKSATWAAYDGVTEPSSSGWPWSLGLNFRIARSTIADNAAGGIRFVDAASAEPSPRLRLGAYEVLMRGLIVAGNRGVGISYDPAASAAKAMIQVNNSWGNEGGNWDGATSITGNSISADPRFRDCDNPDLDNRDYSLQPSSPCIAWADYRPNWTMEGKHERDLAGTEGRPTPWGRLWDDNCDMGTYQYVPQEGEPEADREKPSGLTVHELYVDRDWPGPHNGTAEAPFRSITDAVNAVRPIRGPREIYNIRIADGVYDRSIESFGGFGIDLSYQIVNIFGGYEGWAPNSGERRKATFDWREKNRKPRSTIIDPQGDSRAFVTNQEAITHHRFDGLTIRNGRAVGPGGAVITQALGGEAAMVAFNDCLFENNQCTGDGGAIAACTGDFPEYVTNCDFVDNRAGGNGGAVY